jgi:hypothetical protein
MTVRVNKQPFNLREKLSELERPIGVKGNELMRAETAQDARDLVSAGRKNLVINGDMRISQRYGFNNPQTVTNQNDYYLDRFVLRENTSGAFQVRQSTPGYPFEAAMQINVTNADTSLSGGQYARIQYYVEGNDARAVDWGESESKDYLTLSFWVKSNAPGDYHVSIENSNNNYFPIMVKKYRIERSGEWQKVVVTFPSPGEYNFHRGTGRGLAITWSLAIGSNYNSASTDTWFTTPYLMSTSAQRNFMDTVGNDFYLTGVQLERGRNATDFEHRSYAEELKLCERYFEKNWQNNNTASPHSGGDGYNTISPGVHNGSRGYYVFKFRTQKRIRPSLDYGGKFRVFGASTTTNIVFDEFYSPGVDAGRMRLAHSGSAGDAFILEHDGGNSSDGYISADAEL